MKWQYYALLSRALQGESLYNLKWNVSRVEGWCAIHAAGILHGENFIWPDLRLSRVGRTFLKVKRLREQGRKNWAADLDL